jgi:hypothetical protein
MSTHAPLNSSNRSATTGGSGIKPAFVRTENMRESINLQYPMNVEGDEQQGHYIMFFINKVDSAKVNKYKKELARHKMAVEYGAETQADAPISPTGTSALSSAPKGALAVKRPATVRLEKAISLYMPGSVKATYSSLYADTEIGAGAQAAASMIQSAIDSSKSGTLAADAKSMVGIGSGGAKKWASAGQTLGDAAIAQTFTALKGIETVGGPILGMQGALAAGQIASGKVMSDKMELLFTGVGRRKFSYTFTFIPKSEKESEMVAKIVHTFKKHMTPSFGSIGALGMSSTAGGRILNIPETFDIQYMYKGNENPWINKISSCYLTNLDVQYGSDKAGFYEPLEKPAKTGMPGAGPVPTHTTISLNFEEIEKMSRERIEQGF